MSNTESKSSNKLVVAIIALVVVIAAVLVVWKVASPTTTEGAKTITLTVVYEDASTEEYTIQTDAEYLKEAIESTIEIDGEDSSYGYSLYTVNGVTADFTTSTNYWAIYVNGDYGMYSLDSQPVEDGDSFSLVYESWG